MSETKSIESETPAAVAGAAPCSAISEQQLNKMDVCRHLLPDPGPEVAGQLIAEIRRLRVTLAWIAGQQNLFFAECSQAEEIVARCKEALSPNAALCEVADKTRPN